MVTVNVVVLAGTVAADPVERTMPSGDEVPRLPTAISIAEVSASLGSNWRRRRYDFGPELVVEACGNDGHGPALPQGRTNVFPGDRVPQVGGDVDCDEGAFVAHS